MKTAIRVSIALAVWSMPGFGDPNWGVISVPPATPCRVRSASDSPMGLMHRFEEAYECGDLESYAGLFTMDFVFLSDDPWFRAEHPRGFDRDQEIESAHHLFEGFTRANGTHLPLAVRIDLQIDPIELALDPEMAGPPERYRLATVGALRLVVDQGDGEQIVSIGQRHQFHLIRGETAQLTDGQYRDADHWYIRKWVEHVQFDSSREAPLRAMYR